MLNFLGYTVEISSHGDECISKYKDAFIAGEPFDLVIMDLTIPGGKGGQETIPELKAIDPNVKAIVSSGYSMDPVMAEYQSYGFVATIKKPFDIEILSSTVYEIINNVKK